MITDPWTKIDHPSIGEVRLYLNDYLPIQTNGRVDVYISEEWGNVADDGSWSLEDGEVVCRQLGFEISSKIHKSILFCNDKGMHTHYKNSIIYTESTS